MYLSRLFSIFLVHAIIPSPSVSLLAFTIWKANCERKYLAKMNAVVFYVIGSALYIDYDLRSGFFGAVRTDSVPNLVNQIFTREKVRLGRVTDLNACKRILIFL